MDHVLFVHRLWFVLGAFHFLTDDTASSAETRRAAPRDPVRVIGCHKDELIIKVALSNFFIIKVSVSRCLKHFKGRTCLTTLSK